MALATDLQLEPRILSITGLSRETDVSISAVAAASAALGSTKVKGGAYDILSDVDSFIAIGSDPATGLTTSTGYPILAGNVVTVWVQTGHKIGVIAASSGTLKIHRVTQ